MDSYIFSYVANSYFCVQTHVCWCNQYLFETILALKCLTYLSRGSSCAILFNFTVNKFIIVLMH